ncbi:hypothetical protein NQ317_010483 [Molorchus minor]|uniref:Uncharacterized protein n=1 Tax=Molorchus minor TaxID=1323400 RepID=A0ABQ9K1K3_9CUCU|nr:hypothetical protein NQ317_010483 [Molorchus minor]
MTGPLGTVQTNFLIGTVFVCGEGLIRVTMKNRRLENFSWRSYRCPTPTTLLLLSVGQDISGLFQCEVSADAPLFHTEMLSAPMTVAVYGHVAAFLQKECVDRRNVSPSPEGIVTDSCTFGLMLGIVLRRFTMPVGTDPCGTQMAPKLNQVSEEPSMKQA